MVTKAEKNIHPNHIDYNLGTHFGDKFVLEHVVDGAIAFANGDVKPDAQLHVRPLGKLDDGSDYYFAPIAGEVLKVDRAMALQEFSERMEKAREYAVATLETMAAGLGPLTELLGSWNDVDEAVDVALYPTLKLDGARRPIVGWRTSGSSDPKKWINFAALLVAGRGRGDQTDVGRCHLDSCKRFFKIEHITRGKPSRKYCPGTNHMSLAHALGSTSRARKKRQKDAEQRRAISKSKKPRRR